MTKDTHENNVATNGIQHSSGNTSNSCPLLLQHAIDPSRYVTQSSINEQQDVAVALSNKTISVFPDCRLDSGVTFYGHKKCITGLKFSKENPSLLYSSSTDGRIRVWDIRKGNENVLTLAGSEDNVKKPLNCFDFNVNERLICAGTEVVREDAFIIFWDQRTTKILGGYWNSHTDDITQVCFHPTSVETLASASVDGLINVYDLNESSEKDALINTLNSNSSVNKISWTNDGTQLSCLTDIEEYQLWVPDEARPNISLTRDEFERELVQHVDRFVDTFSLDSHNILCSTTMSGSFSAWKIAEKKLDFYFTIENGHTDLIRTICSNPQKKVLVTGGEDGAVCIWKA